MGEDKAAGAGAVPKARAPAKRPAKKPAVKRPPKRTAKRTAKRPAAPNTATEPATGREPDPVTQPVPRRRARRRRRRRPLSDTWKRLLLRSLGWVFILLGILGLFLPILQGILFLLIGVFILSRVSPRVRLWRQRLRRWARRRYPKWTGKIEEAEHKAKAWVHRILKPKKA